MKKKSQKTGDKYGWLLHLIELVRIKNIQMKKLIYIIAISILFFNTGITQPETELIESKVPSLNGHAFPSLGPFRSSFITSSLHANLGFGNTSSIEIPGIILDDYELFAFEGKILFVSIDVQYQQRFNSWLALFVSFKMAGRLGTDMSTILADGVNTLSGGDIGWLVKIKQSRKFNLSGSIRLLSITGNFINVSDYFKDIIENNPNPSVIKKVPAKSIGIGIEGAYAFNPTFGLQFHTEYAYGESFVRGKTDGFFLAGVVGDIDFMPKHNVPVGLALGYTITSAPEIVMSDGGFSNLINAKIGYTGSKDFELGLQYTYYNVEIKSVEEKPFVSKFLLVLKFYF